MNVTKNNIKKAIAKKSLISNDDSYLLLESFIASIKIQVRLNEVKLSGFGSFSFKSTPKRIGRNPKTKDSYIIPPLNRLSFKPSKKIKEKIN
jgi:integration host factor subunit alpha